MYKTVKTLAAVALAIGLTACAVNDTPVKEQGVPAEQIVNSQTINTEEQTMYVLLKTNKGDIVLELNASKAPETVKNFIKYVEEGQYSGTIFHRVIKGFMVQGGGMDAQMKERTTRAPIMNEADNGLVNDKYTVAMARTSDPDSATAQFFINTNKNDFLNFKSHTVAGYGYAVFGKVISGQNVVDAIEAVATARKYPHDDVPVDVITIESAEVLKDYKPAI